MARHAAVWRGSFWCRGGTIRSESPPKVRRLRPGCRAAAGTGASLCVDPLAKHVVKDSAVPVVLHFQLGIETADKRRSEERRVGQEWVSTGKSGGSPEHSKKKKKEQKKNDT